MDFARLDTLTKANEGAEIELLHPVDRSPIGVTVRILGSDSDVYRDMERKHADKRIRNFERGKMRLSPEEVESESLEMLLACLIGWEGVEEHGETVPFTAENARRFMERYRWMREQIASAIGDRRNFIPA